MSNLIPIGPHVKLRQGLAVNKGSAHLVSDEKDEVFCVPLLRIADMMAGTFTTYISKYAPSNVFARRGDIIYTRTGQIGLVFNHYEGCVHNNSFVVELLDDVFDKEYLIVALKSSFVRDQALNKAMSSVQPDLTHNMFKDILIPFFDKNIQKKIAKQYNSIEDKIANNNKIITELESMAKTLYDYWFLQFEFPNEEGKPYKSSGGKMVYNEELKREIPEGWEVKTIGDILIEANKSTVQVNGAKEKGCYPFFTSGESILAYDDFFVDGFNIFLNTGGNPDIKAYKGKCAYSTDTWCINGSKYSFVLFYYFLKLMPQFEQLFFAGSGLKHLQKDALKNKYIFLPGEIVIKQFNYICDSQWSKITNCIRENQELASLRDFLLPMLMNGQATFKED
ncbi:MAG: restriction endonuclease subunit S [Bacilli bacterium]|nr:restriction endonuclease subunit S [Bacilli bacterium]